jgi:hypothetical protein
MSYHFPFEDRDPLAHLPEINARLERMGMKFRVAHCMRNSDVSFTMELVGDEPESMLPTWDDRRVWTFCISRHLVDMEMLYDRFLRLITRSGWQREGIARTDAWLVCLTKDAFFAVSLNEGILYEGVVEMEQLPTLELPPKQQTRA